MWSKVLKIVLWFVGLMTFAWMVFLGSMYFKSATHSVKRQDLVGRYTGTFGGGTEVIVFHEDGTFDQQFTRAKAVEYKNTGTWDFDGHTLHYHHFVYPANYLDPGSAKSIIYSDFDDPDPIDMNGMLIYDDDRRVWVYHE